MMNRAPGSTGERLSRRQLLRRLAGLGLSAAGLALLDACAGSLAAPSVAVERLETTTIRLTHVPSGAGLCLAPQYLAEQLLHDEGFTRVVYTPLKASDVGAAEMSLIAGDADISLGAAPPVITRLDAGQPLVVLSGDLIGCFELFGTDQVKTISDLKGRTIPVDALGNSQHILLASIVAWAGLDPNRDINWAVHPLPEAITLLSQGKVDAFLAFPPGGQELRAHNVGHVLLNSMVDKPWSQYNCCMVVGRKEFVQQNPVATKRALRAILKATDSVVQDPARAARFMVEKGEVQNYDYALEAMQSMPYNHWRDYDPADTLLFYSLRLREAGMIKNDPETIVAQNTDWRFLNELKQEMPAPTVSARNVDLFCRLGKRG